MSGQFMYIQTVQSDTGTFKFLFLSSFKTYYNTPIVKAENKYQNKKLFY